MCRFRFFAPAAVQAHDVRATLVQGARNTIRPRDGETRKVVIEVGGHFVVESGERDVLFGGHRLDGVVRRGPGGRYRRGPRSFRSRGRARRASRGRPAPRRRASSGHRRRPPSGQSHGVLSGRAEFGNFSRTGNRGRGVRLRAFRGRRRDGGSRPGRVGPWKRRGRAVHLLRIGRRLQLLLPVDGRPQIEPVRGVVYRGQVRFGCELDSRDRGIVIRVRHGHGRVYSEIRGERAVGRRRRPERGLERGIMISVCPGRRRRLRQSARRGRLFGASVVHGGYDTRTVGRAVVQQSALARFARHTFGAGTRVTVHAVHARSAVFAPELRACCLTILLNRTLIGR